MFKKLFQYNSQNLFRFVTVVLGMTDIIKRVWILSAFLWNPPGYTCVVFVVFLIWLEWAEALDFPCLSLGYIWLAKSKYQANYFEKTMFLKWKVVGVLKICDWSFVSTQRPGILFSYIPSISVGQEKENSFLWLYPFWSRFHLRLSSELSFYQQDPESKYFHVKGKQESNEKWSSYSVQLPFDVPPLPYTKDGKIPCLCSGNLA